MKLTTGWWKARDGSKWHVDWVGNRFASGHNQQESTFTWYSDGSCERECHSDMDLIAPWTEPKEGSSAWAQGLPVGSKIRWRSWKAGEYVTKGEDGWVSSKTYLQPPENSYYTTDSGWLLYTEPKLRPWKPDEVPLGAWMRDKQSLRRYLIISDGLEDGHADWLSNYEHSTDGGKTWLPCGVLKESK